MSKKMYALVSGIIGGIGVIASAIVSYTDPAQATAILAAIPIAITAANEIMMLFVEPEAKK